jgi:hypothetical protein
MKPLLDALRNAIQHDVGRRGLARDSGPSLFGACPADFAAACRSLASHSDPVLGVVTGFWIPSASLGETDGPLGAIYLARTLSDLGIQVRLITETHCLPPLWAGLDCLPGLEERVCVEATSPRALQGLTHLLALERVGPGHTSVSLQTQPGCTDEDRALFAAEVPIDQQGRCRTMRGLDISDHMVEIAECFEQGKSGCETIGIGDGGNEIGMGKIPWRVIRDSVPLGGLIACRVATDQLIVAGVSNWGAYALANGVALLRGHSPSPDWFDATLELAILRQMVERGPLVDGVTGRREPTVDGLPFETYIQPLQQIEAIMRGKP